MSQLKSFSETGFEEDVLKSDKPVLVDFYADWCGPCKMMAPVIHEIAAEYAARLTVGKLDVDASPSIAMRYGVMGIPTLGMFQGGKLVDRMVGYPGPAGVKAWVEKTLQQSAAA